MTDNASLTDKEIQAGKAIYGVTENDAFAAIFEDRPMTIKFQVGSGEHQRELSIKVMWPDADDETEITIRATEFMGVAPEQATQMDYAVARGRAAIEQLAHTPYPEWLVGAGGERLRSGSVIWRGKERLQPDTGRLKSKAIPAQFWVAYSAVIARFQHLVFDL